MDDLIALVCASVSDCHSYHRLLAVVLKLIRANKLRAVKVVLVRYSRFQKNHSHDCSLRGSDSASERELQLHERLEAASRRDNRRGSWEYSVQSSHRACNCFHCCGLCQVSMELSSFGVTGADRRGSGWHSTSAAGVRTAASQS